MYVWLPSLVSYTGIGSSNRLSAYSQQVDSDWSLLFTWCCALRIDRPLPPPTDEIPQFPAHKVKRSAAIICSRHPTEKILPASRSEPARYVHERKAVSGYWQGDDLIPKTGGSPSVPLKSFDSLCWASLGSFSISISHDSECVVVIIFFVSLLGCRVGLWFPQQRLMVG